MTSPEKILAAKASEAVAALYGTAPGEASIQIQPTRKEFEGDCTIVVFPLLRLSHTTPELTATAIGSKIKELWDAVASFNVVKGFLNISLSPEYWRSVLELAAFDPSFRVSPSTGRNVMVEFSSPNTNKPLHLGHIRNNLLGDSVVRILRAGGDNVISATLVNDRGIHICKSMLAWLKTGNGETPESSGKKGDHLVGDYYVAFDRMYKEEVTALVAGGMDEDTAKKEAPCLKEARQMLLKWEQGDPGVRDLWKKMNAWVLDGFAETYKTLGISFDKTYFESETYLLGKSLVEKGLADGVFVRDPDGSVWCDLTSDGLDRKLLLRSDGTSVYMTQDLGTAESRFSEYKLDSHVYVVGDEQNYHFQVLKLVLSKLGFPWADQIFHLSYGMVELPNGKMKSREGTVVDADDLLEKMYLTAKETSEGSDKLSDLDPEEREKLYRMIALGALKYFIIKVDPKKTMLFNPEESIDFNGNTGPFIQYTHARIRSILRKASEKGVEIPDGRLPSGFLPSPKEIRLVKLLSQYPARLHEAVDTLSPSVMANYAYETAKEFNQYYHETPVLREEDQVALGGRLALLGAVAATLRQTASLLGFELPERM